LPSEVDVLRNIWKHARQALSQKTQSPEGAIAKSSNEPAIPPKQANEYPGASAIPAMSTKIDPALSAATTGMDDAPADLNDCIAWATSSQNQRDWVEAARRWSGVRQRFPDAWAGYAGGATALKELGKLTEATALLDSVADRFANHVGWLHDCARLAETRGDWSAAERLWREFLAIDDKPWWVYTSLARAVRECGRTDEAIDILLEAQTKLPQETPLFTEFAKMAEAEKDWETALERWEAIGEKFPDLWAAYSGSAAALTQLGRTEEAEEKLRSAADRFPDEPLLLHDLARFAERQKNWAEAERRWRDFLRVNDKTWWAHKGLADALQSQQRTDEAEAALEAAQERLPNEAILFAHHATLAEARSDWETALARWTAFRERFPNNSTGYIRIGAVLRHLHQADQAEDILIKAAAQFPADTGLLQELAFVAGQNGHWETAERCWRDLIAARPDAVSGYRELANALKAQGKPDEADRALKEGQERHPNSLELASAAGDMLVSRGNYLEGARHYEAMLARFPHEVGPRVQLIEALIHLDRAQDALAVISEALTQWPSNTHLNQKKIELLLRSGEQESAFQLFRKIADSDLSVDFKYSVAWQIFLSKPPEDIAIQLVDYFIDQPDPGDRLWLPFISVMIYRAGEVREFAKQLLATGRIHGSGPAYSIFKALSGDIFSDEELDGFFSLYLPSGRIPIMANTIGFFYYAGKAGVKEHIAKLFEEYIARQLRPDWEPEPIELLACFIFAAVFSERAFAGLLTWCRRKLPAQDPSLPLSTAAGVISSIIRHARLDAVDKSSNSMSSPAIVRRQGKLRVAMCVSGQLRGYEAARPSWDTLDFGEAELSYFVSTWREIGQNWDRAWTPYRDFPLIFNAIKGPRGMELVKSRYPQLGSAMVEALRVGEAAKPEYLRELYGTDQIEIEDDRKGIFVNQPNTWKMYHKIGRAHEMALGSGKDFDLFVKIRPDQRIDGKRELDWGEIADVSARGKILYLDIRLEFTSDILKMGDQFVVGARDAMDVYAGIGKFYPANRAPDNILFDAPPRLAPHTTPGYYCTYNGVIARWMTGFRFNGMLNPTALTPSEILALVRLDTQARAMDEFDRTFVEATEAIAAR
jgi:tetratricopeptide (TPR) repeat protein